MVIEVKVADLIFMLVSGIIMAKVRLFEKVNEIIAKFILV